jgi:hypothetical protein
MNRSMKSVSSFRNRVANYIRNRLRNQNPGLRLSAEKVMEVSAGMVSVSWRRGKFPRDTATRALAHYWNMRNAA